MLPPFFDVRSLYKYLAYRVSKNMYLILNVNNFLNIGRRMLKLVSIERSSPKFLFQCCLHLGLIIFVMPEMALQIVAILVEKALIFR